MSFIKKSKSMKKVLKTFNMFSSTILYFILLFCVEIQTLTYCFVLIVFCYSFFLYNNIAPAETPYYVLFRDGILYKFQHGKIDNLIDSANFFWCIAFLALYFIL